MPFAAIIGIQRTLFFVDSVSALPLLIFIALSIAHRLTLTVARWSLWVIESSAQTVCVQTYSLPLPNLHKISAPWSEFRLKLQSLGPVQCHGNFSIRQSISDKCACKSTSPRNFSLKTWPRISVNLHSESEGIPAPNSIHFGRVNFGVF